MEGFVEMPLESKKIGGSENVGSWQSLINPAVGENKTASRFYNFAPRDEFNRGNSENKLKELIQGRGAVASAAEIASPPSQLKGISRFRS